MRGDRPCFGCEAGGDILFTPHARGSTPEYGKYLSWLTVYPACAGIDPFLESPTCTFCCLPRMRGDRPVRAFLKYPWGEFTPHARGSTYKDAVLSRKIMVYPACAGIDLAPSDTPNISPSLPRMRGDRPCSLEEAKKEARFTPHARGSTDHPDHLILPHIVYPACAGIDPPSPPSKRVSTSLPRMRGDRPDSGFENVNFRLFTPHARGSTSCCRERLCCTKVYPACAGIDPAIALLFKTRGSLPRMRGDRPFLRRSRITKRMFTPHARGSTLRRLGTL